MISKEDILQTCREKYMSHKWARELLEELDSDLVVLQIDFNHQAAELKIRPKEPGEFYITHTTNGTLRVWRQGFDMEFGHHEEKELKAAILDQLTR